MNLAAFERTLMSVRLDVCRRLISNSIDMYVRATRKVDSSGANLYPEPFACCLKNQFFRSLLFVRVARVRHPVRLALEFPQSLTAPRLRDLPRIRRLLHLPVIAPRSFAPVLLDAVPLFGGFFLSSPTRSGRRRRQRAARSRGNRAGRGRRPRPAHA